MVSFNDRTCLENEENPDDFSKYNAYKKRCYNKMQFRFKYILNGIVFYKQNLILRRKK